MSTMIETEDALSYVLDCSAVLTHHWLVRKRGGENVLAALCELLPGSPIYTLVHDPEGMGGGWPEVRTSWLQLLPAATRLYPNYLPLMPAAAKSIMLPPVDLVVCSDAAIAKAMSADQRSFVACYCHSPMRYVWDMADDYRGRLPAFLAPLWDLLVPRVRAADYAAAQRVHLFIANSKHVADRIRRNYGRDSVVVHPPVDLPAEAVTRPRESYYLCAGHHVGYKRLDLAVEACGVLGRKLVVIGDGPGVAPLRRSTPAHVTLLGWLAADEIVEHYSRAAALLFPGEEDFGIVPVEAMSHGCPVIAYGVGGACETVEPDLTGVWFDEQSVDCLVDAMSAFEKMTFDPVAMHAYSQRFDKARFLREMHHALRGGLARHSGA